MQLSREEGMGGLWRGWSGMKDTWTGEHAHHAWGRMTAGVITTGIVLLAAVVVMMIIGFTVFEVVEKSMGYFPMNGVFSVNKIGVSPPVRMSTASVINNLFFWRGFERDHGAANEERRYGQITQTGSNSGSHHRKWMEIYAGKYHDPPPRVRHGKRREILICRSYKAAGIFFVFFFFRWSLHYDVNVPARDGVG